jgi:single-strand DNA-binding protein
MSGFTINTVTISGNLTRDPELRSTSGGTSVCKLRIASNERYKDSTGEWADRPNYFDVTIWKGMGEWVGNNLHKGDQVVVEGRLRWHEWEAEGGKRQAVDITANSVVPVTRDGSGSGSGTSSRASYQDQDSDIPADTSDLPPVGAAASSAAPAGDDDIPF